MNLKRDKFLTEQLGECWHDVQPTKFFSDGCPVSIRCSKCNEPATIYNNFSTWKDFGKLWKWAQKQTWWKKFIEPIGKIVCDCGECNDCMIDTHWIDPDIFADTIYEFLITNNEV